MKTECTKTEHKYLQVVGQNIRSARLNLGLSQEKFAKVCKLDRTYISDVERGERNLSLLTLRKFSKALKISVSELVNVS